MMTLQIWIITLQKYAMYLQYQFISTSFLDIPGNMRFILLQRLSAAAVALQSMCRQEEKQGLVCTFLSFSPPPSWCPAYPAVPLDRGKLFIFDDV